MTRNLKYRIVIIAVAVLACVYFIIGIPKSRAELAANIEKNIRLGLDLRGGSHLVLQVQVQDAFKGEADVTIERMKEEMTKQGISFSSFDRNDPKSIDEAETIEITVKGVPLDKTQPFRQIVIERFPQWVLASVSSTDYSLKMRPTDAIALRNDTVERAVQTIHKRIDGLGVAEATVQPRGRADADSEIVIQMPGEDDPARVKSIISQAAVLELAEVKDGPFPSMEAALGKHGGVRPLGTRLVRQTAQPGAEGEAWYLLAQTPVVTGRDLRNARPSRDEFGRWETDFQLSQEAGRRFGRYTEANVGNRMAIILDGLVRSAPTIQNRIEDSGRITGAASEQDAADLALVLRSGSLPAGLLYLQETTVGPSLGADSIRRGVTAGLVGLALVVASMLLYYRGAGVNAVLALLLNTIITIAALSYFDATWTLPGIAGLVLSIGMAVDSNVLIFERIKEEQRGGKGVEAAIGAGFDRAMVTIIDTHVTTVVASAFLFIFGSGPVKGFAVTLVIGLVANLFTAVFVSRTIFNLQVWRTPRLTSLSIGSGLRFFEEAKFDFLSKRKITLGLSVLAIAISIGSLVIKGGPEYGLDFRGGTSIVVKFDPPPSIEELRQALSGRLQGEITVQQTKESGEFLIGTALADEKSLEAARQAVETTLREKYANVGPKLDLNTTNLAAVTDRLRNTLPAAGVTLPEAELKVLAGQILSYRDTVRSGLVKNLDELAQVKGVDQKVLGVVKQEFGLGSFNLRSAAMVGPRAGEELRQQAVLATLYALGGMLVYIAFRFEWVSGAAAVIATIHDVVITLGLFSLTGREINLTIIAALLTLIGYSMNDKIVVFDRVRENQKKKRAASSFLDMVNQSINQTLSRTMLTAGPTLLACLALYFLGGEVLNGIAFALFVGIIVGTYSSIFVASALLVMWRDYRGGHGATRARPRAQATPAASR